MDETTLIKSRDQLLKRIEDYFLHSAFVKGIFLGGSLSTGNPDAYSDIDLRIVVNQEPKSIILDSFIKKMKSISFIETKASSYYVIHFDNFIKVDLFVYYEHELEPSIWLKDIKIIHDTDNLLGMIKVESDTITYSISQKEFDMYISKYFAFLHESYRRLKRKEYHYAHSCLLKIKNILVSMWYIEIGEQPNTLGDWAKYEGKKSKLSIRQKEYLNSNLNYDCFQENPEEFYKGINSEVNKVSQKISSLYNLKFNVKDYKQITCLVTNESI